MWSEDPQRRVVRSPSDAKWAVPTAWRKSTGPRTPEGLEWCRTANWKHGMYAKEALAERQRVRGVWREVDAFIRNLEKAIGPR